MKNPDSNDDDLRAVFATLKAEDVSNAPPFFVPQNQRGVWRLRPAIPALAAAVAILVSVMILHNPDPPGVSTIEFDELSELISRELFAASAGNWKAPSDFLLESNQLVTK